MLQHQMLPPAGGATTRVNGRVYFASSGAVTIAPDFDADELEANGWIKVASGGAGTSAQRPVRPAPGTAFHDQTLAKNIVYDGRNWRDPATGALV
jgi:hypothetical protein